MELLEMHHAPILGIVLIGTLSTREMYSYYQSYYYTAKPAKDDQSSKPPEPSGSGEGSATPTGASRHALPVDEVVGAGTWRARLQRHRPA